MIGEIIGNYRVLDRIAEGGMGAVYRAEHQLIGRMAAVKVLHPELTANKDVVNRFFNEAKSTSAIKHPGIVEIFDFGYLPSGHAYLVMELLEGTTLSMWRRQRGLVHEGEAAMILRGVCSALAAAHSKGIVHRDLKPDNIFLLPDAESTTGTRSKLLDFGIAKLTDVGAATSTTKTGAVMGTPTYMSPEQCRGSGQVDHRADLYSIGCMFYELLAGRPPFVNEGAGELIGSHLFVAPEPPSRFVTGISPDVEGLIMALLDKQPDRRVQSARELAGALGQIAHRHGWMPLTSDLDVRASLGHISLTDPRISAANLTPSSFTPVSRMATPVPMAMHTPAPPAPHYTQPAPPQTPTTLSGAASQTVPPTAPPSKRGLRVGLIAAGVLAIGGVVAVVATRGGSKPASDPSHEVIPAKAAEPAADVKPAVVDPKPVVVDPTPAVVDTAPADVKPVDTTPTDTKPADTKPADTKPVTTSTKPTGTKPTGTKPTGTKPTKTKPTGTKPTKTKPEDLLETDL